MSRWKIAIEMLTLQATLLPQVVLSATILHSFHSDIVDHITWSVVAAAASCWQMELVADVLECC